MAFERGMYGRTTTSTSDENDEIITPVTQRAPTRTVSRRQLTPQQQAQLQRQQYAEKRETVAQQPASPLDLATPQPPTTPPALTKKQVIIQQLQQRNPRALGTVKQVGSYPAGTTFTPTPEGYMVNIPESSQLEFSKTVIGQAERHPPGIRNVVLTQTYAGLNLASVGKGVADFLGVGPQYDVAMAWQFSGARKKEFGELIKTQKYGTRYTSWGAYLPGGIKGETKLLEKHPVEATIGNIGAEVLQFAGFNLATKPITKGATYLFKAGAQRLPRVAPRLSSKLGETVIGQNVKLWSKGNVPVNLFKRVNQGTIRESTKGLGTESVSVIQKFKYVPQRSWGFAQRQFIPKQEALSYASKLGRQSIDISFPTVRSYGKAPGIQTEITGIVESKGLSKRMQGFYTSLREDRSLQSRILTSYKATGTHGSLINVGRGRGALLESEILGREEVEKLSSVPRMSRNPEWYNLAKRYNIDTTRPYKVPKGFFKSESGGASLMRPQSELVLRRTSGATRNAFSYDADLMKLSTRGYIPLSSLVFGATKGFTMHQRMKPETLFIQRDINEQPSALKQISQSLSKQEHITLPKMDTKQERITDSISDTMKTTIPRQKKTTKVLTAQDFGQGYNFRLYPPFLPKKRLRGPYGDYLFNVESTPRYKFREFKIPELL